MTGCKITGKRRYPTIDDANNALKLIKKQKTQFRTPIRYYPCDHCHGWHITSVEGHAGKEKPLKNPDAFKKYMQ